MLSYILKIRTLEKQNIITTEYPILIEINSSDILVL